MRRWGQATPDVPHCFWLLSELVASPLSYRKDIRASSRSARTCVSGSYIFCDTCVHISSGAGPSGRRPCPRVLIHIGVCGLKNEVDSSFGTKKEKRGRVRTLCLRGGFGWQCALTSACLLAGLLLFTTAFLGILEDQKQNSYRERLSTSVWLSLSKATHSIVSWEQFRLP